MSKENKVVLKSVIGILTGNTQRKLDYSLPKLFENIRNRIKELTQN